MNDPRHNLLFLGLRDGVLSAEQVSEVAEAAAGMRLVVGRERALVESHLEGIEVAAGWFPPELLARAPRLRWYQQWSAGSDWLLDHPAAAEAAFLLTNTSGIHAIPMSEHILAFMLAHARALPRAGASQRSRTWLAHDVFELAGKTVLLLGLGQIGRHTAQLCAALDLRVLGVRRDASRGVANVSEMVPLERLLEVLPQADFVVNILPLTPATERLLGEAEFRAMKESAYLLNVGRGRTVDEAALTRALSEGWIAGAGLDVFEEEPLPASSPLWEMENVIITSHYSGATPEYDRRALAILVDNLGRYRRGEALRNLVDKGRGY